MTLVLFIFVNLVFFCPKMILCIKIEISRNDFYNSLGFHFHFLFCPTRPNLLTADVWSWLLTVLAGPWVGAGLLLLLVLGTVVYRNRARAARLAAAQQQQAVPPFNSYAESYEVSSHLPSNHHMAIQVKEIKLRYLAFLRFVKYLLQIAHLKVWIMLSRQN